jgi:hypothetical protein
MFFLVFVHRPIFQKTPKNTTFKKFDLFPSSDERLGDTYSVGFDQRFGLAHSNGTGIPCFAEFQPFLFVYIVQM